MKVRITYPALSESRGQPIYEDVEALDLDRQTPDGLEFWELRAHALFVPLAPGDVVVVDWRTREERPEVREIEEVKDLYTYDVDFMLPATLVTGQALADDDPAQRAIQETIELWRREAWATQHTGLSAYVSAPEQEWLEDRVVLCEYVDHVETVRWPGMDIDFTVARANADLGDLTKGPWA